MGFQLGGTVAVFLGAGYLFDHWLGSTPWGSLLGGVIGIAAALRFVAHMNAESGAG
jgi:F0F1-type ATP synthase assembly protein I